MRHVDISRKHIFLKFLKGKWQYEQETQSTVTWRFAQQTKAERCFGIQ